MALVNRSRLVGTGNAGSGKEYFMRTRLSSLSALLGLFLVPVLTFATPGQDCARHPENPNCVVTVPEHWGVFESLGFYALVLIAFWVLIRLGALCRNVRESLYRPLTKCVD
jgi:hypothetical protein